MKKLENLEKWEPIITHLVQVDFSCSGILTEQILSIYGNVMTFNVNVIDGVISPVDVINEYLNTPITVSLKYHSRDGKVLTKVELVNFKFTKFLDLLDFTYDIEVDVNPIKKIQVEFTYEELIV